MNEQQIIMLGDSIVLRVKALLVYLALAATVVITHMDLLHFSHSTNDLIQLGCFVILGLQNPVVSKFNERNS